MMEINGFERIILRLPASNDVNYKLQDDLQNSYVEFIWFEIFVFKTRSILFGCYCCPPESSKYFSNDLD